jgi:cyclase
MKIRKTTVVSLILLLFIVQGIAADIHEAALKGDLERVKALLNKDPRLVNAPGGNGKAPLHWAAQGGHVEIVEFLIERGAVVNSKNVADETPLHYAAALGHCEVVKLLIEKGALLNPKTILGETPLHYSTNLGQFESVQLLIEKRTDLNVKNNEGRTPLDYASDRGFDKIEQLLSSKGGIYSPMKNLDVSCLAENIFRMTIPFRGQVNIGASVGPDGILLIDTGFNKRAVEELETTIKELKDGKIRYIINTHLHWDHVNGNHIGTENTIKIDHQKLEQMATTGIIIRGKRPLKGKTGKAFDTNYSLRFNGEEIRIIPYPGIHSDSDLIVYFTGSGVVHMGDLLLSQSFPSIGTRVKEYMNLLEKIIDVFPEDSKFISGHGRNLSMKGVLDYQKMLLTTIEIIKNGMEEGKSVEDMQKERVLKDYESYNTFLRGLDTDYWIGAIYQNIKSAV